MKAMYSTKDEEKRLDAIHDQLKHQSTLAAALAVVVTSISGV